jgi:hypothetical protein
MENHVPDLIFGDRQKEIFEVKTARKFDFFIKSLLKNLEFENMMVSCLTKINIDTGHHMDMRMGGGFPSSLYIDHTKFNAINKVHQNMVLDLDNINFNLHNDSDNIINTESLDITKSFWHLFKEYSLTDYLHSNDFDMYIYDIDNNVIDGTDMDNSQLKILRILNIYVEHLAKQLNDIFILKNGLGAISGHTPILKKGRATVAPVYADGYIPLPISPLAPQTAGAPAIYTKRNDIAILNYLGYELNGVPFVCEPPLYYLNADTPHGRPFAMSRVALQLVNIKTKKIYNHYIFDVQYGRYFDGATLGHLRFNEKDPEYYHNIPMLSFTNSVHNLIEQSKSHNKKYKRNTMRFLILLNAIRLNYIHPFVKNHLATTPDLVASLREVLVRIPWNEFPYLYKNKYYLNITDNAGIISISYNTPLSDPFPLAIDTTDTYEPLNSSTCQYNLLTVCKIERRYVANNLEIKQLENHHAEIFFNNLTEQNREAIRSYTGNEYIKLINYLAYNYLFDVNPDIGLETTLNRMYESYHSITNTHNDKYMIIYSARPGIITRTTELFDTSVITVGTLVKMPAFTSFTFDINVARRFLNSSYKRDLFVVLVPINEAKILCLDGTHLRLRPTTVPGEREVLLPFGSELQVVKIDDIVKDNTSITQPMRIIYCVYKKNALYPPVAYLANFKTDFFNLYNGQIGMYHIITPPANNSPPYPVTKTININNLGLFRQFDLNTCSPEISAYILENVSPFINIFSIKNELFPASGHRVVVIKRPCRLYRSDIAGYPDNLGIPMKDPTIYFSSPHTVFPYTRIIDFEGGKYKNIKRTDPPKEMYCVKFDLDEDNRLILFDLFDHENIQSVVNFINAHPTKRVQYLKVIEIYYKYLVERDSTSFANTGLIINPLFVYHNEVIEINYDGVTFSHERNAKSKQSKSYANDTAMLNIVLEMGVSMGVLYHGYICKNIPGLDHRNLTMIDEICITKETIARLNSIPEHPRVTTDQDNIFASGGTHPHRNAIYKFMEHIFITRNFSININNPIKQDRMTVFFATNGFTEELLEPYTGTDGDFMEKIKLYRLEEEYRSIYNKYVLTPIVHGGSTNIQTYKLKHKNLLGGVHFFDEKMQEQILIAKALSTIPSIRNEILEFARSCVMLTRTFFENRSLTPEQIEPILFKLFTKNSPQSAGCIGENLIAFKELFNRHNDHNIRTLFFIIMKFNDNCCFVIWDIIKNLTNPTSKYFTFISKDKIIARTQHIENILCYKIQDILELCTDELFNETVTSYLNDTRIENMCPFGKALTNFPNLCKIYTCSMNIVWLMRMMYITPDDEQVRVKDTNDRSINVEDAIPPLSIYEEQYIKTIQLPWKVGQYSWKITDNNFWRTIAEKKNKILIAGPSGTADYMLGIASLFTRYQNSKNLNLILAGLIVWMVYDHSIHEILCTAPSFGLSYDINQDLIDEIIPSLLNVEEKQLFKENLDRLKLPLS